MSRMNEPALASLLQRFGDVHFRWRPVTVHGLNPYPPHDLIHVELQTCGLLQTAEEKAALTEALRSWLGEEKFDRIWTFAYVAEQGEATKGLPLAELSEHLDQDYF